MRGSLALCVGAVTLIACAGPMDPAQPLDGVWKLDSASAGVPPRIMTLTQRGMAVTGTGSAMGVDVPMPIAITGTYTPPSGTGFASVALHFAFENGGGITADFNGTLSPGGRLDGTAAYYGIFTNGPVTGSLAFSRPQPTDSQTTGLTGTVRRGPITPVCQVGVPCDAPFAAGFQVWQGSRFVAGFQSDSAGHYLVLLAPGAYTVVPDSTAPIFPKGQTRQVTVGPVGLTHLDLEFDTGIR